MPAPTGFPHLQVKELHPTFAAEITGLKLTEPLSDEIFQEIINVVAKVTNTRPSSYVHGADSCP